MRCPSCNAENPEGTKFCIHCGAAFKHSCTKCGFDNPPQAKFCAQCGTALISVGLVADSAERERISSDGLKPRGGREGERRHLTVLFCDLVGSTALASRLDPEEWREMAAGYRHAAAEEITRFGGHVAQYLGDGVMAFFGYPEAHDNDAERAARAGLALLEALDRLNQQPRYAKLSARIGIDSGAVVVQDADVFGDAPNIAARIQAAAAPGTVVISAATQRLVAGLFIVEELGAHALKGVDRPVRLYRVVRPSGVRGRLEAAAAAGVLTPFVGRADELRLLISRWERVRRGEGQVVTIIGEAGIGKSRLVRRFHREIATMPHTWIEAGAGAFFQNTPFYPISELLQQIMADTPGQEPLVQLEARLEAAGFEPAEAVPLIAPLLNLPQSAKYPPLASSPEQQRRQLLATLVAWTLGAAKAQPLVVVTEDLHWVDPSTLELIQLLVEQSGDAPLLLLYTARPEFHAPWRLRAHHTQLMLNRLSVHDARRMVGQVMMHQALPETTIATVVERTGGVPLFVEELTRAVLENGTARLTERTIPVTLHDSLMTRLDRLGPAREVIQIGAVLGDDFSYSLLLAVYPVAEEKLQAALRKLTDAELLYVRGLPPDATYQFKHALIRDAAYEALLKSRRKELHRTVARIIDERFPILKETHPEILARHWTEADVKEQAILQWQRAGHDAMQRSANAEAVSHLTKALELLDTLPESPSRAQQELAVRITLAVPLTLTKGYAAPELEEVYSRARELYQQVGESPQLFPMLVHLWTFYSVKAEYNTARELGAQLMNLAQSAQDPALLIQAHAIRGNTLCFLGELVLARGHLEQAIALYDPQQHQSQAFVYGTDPGVHSLSYATLALWLLGYPEQARKKSLDALALAQKFSHPYSEAFALVHVLYVHRFSREVKATQARAQELFALSAEHGFPITLAVGAAHQGWALAEQGRGEEGILQIRQGIDTWRATGSTLFYQPFLLAMLSEAYAKARLPEEGLSALAEALTIVNKTGERFWEAELYRLKGELTFQSQLRSSQFKVQDEAEECFHRAVDIAARQSAKSLELRAVMSLSRLWQHQGKKAQARQILAEIYEWFTEGFDTADLKEARALLNAF
jgi:predicted ATPase/class 3 adenylate cyclase/ribosomal protein L40E